MKVLRELISATVLFRLKPDVSQSQIAILTKTAKEMVGKIPGELTTNFYCEHQLIL
jgi:hypothetical protein